MVKKETALLLALVSLFGLAGFASATVVIPNPLGGTGDFKTLLLKIASGAGMLIAGLGTIMIIVAGILYLISAGNPDKMKTAKTALTYAIIGIAVGISATLIVEVITSVLK